MIVFTSDITLQGNDEFSKRFNYVSELWSQWKLALNTFGDGSEQEKAAYSEWFDAKLCLEQGHPLPI